MKYEIVNLEEKKIVGVVNTTSNDDAEMTQKIGMLWNDLFGGVYATIKNKANEYAYGLYCDYTEKDYTAMAGIEVSKNENKELVEKIIPAGKYAKFYVEGNCHEVIGKAWEDIWAMPLERNCVADFEEYLNADMEHAKINIYIGLK